jgi:proline dehydrogenase
MPASILHRLLVAPLPLVPKSLVWPLSKRYVAGTDLDSAFATVRALNEVGCSATIDVLGEDSTSRQEVDEASELYVAALAGIEVERLDCNASIKLSDMGLRFDTELCFDIMERLVAEADRRRNFIRIDMEDSSVTSATLDIYRRLRERYDNVGTVIQSCMKRSEDDITRLLDEGLADLRLCKGIYIEPEEIAWTDANEIRNSYQRLLEQLLEGGASRVGIATHDPILVDHAERTIERLGVDRSRYEFQMLLGVAGAMRARLVEKGHPLRVYVPFGERWHAYSLRRLRENPQIAAHIVRNLFTGC